MKYYLPQYLMEGNSPDENVRNESAAKWEASAKAYGPYFESIKNKLPKSFMKEFDKNLWFHDFGIETLVISNAGRYRANIELHIRHYESAYKIIFKNVQSYSLDMPDVRNGLLGITTWGYTEFELREDGYWIIRILCDFYSEFEVVFKTLGISKL